MASPNRLIVSHLLLRKLIGLMGISLPFLLVVLSWLFGERGIESSVSAYYHVDFVGAVFVGFLFAIGLFLLAYQGYPRLDTDRRYEFPDNWVANFAGVFALGVAFFPTRLADPSQLENIFGIIHAVSAALFLLTTAYFAFFLFTKTHPEGDTRTIPPEVARTKAQRNRLYRISGVVIVVSIVLLGVNFIANDPIPHLKPVFVLEAIATVAFGIAWFVKGRALARNPQ